MNVSVIYLPSLAIESLMHGSKITALIPKNYLEETATHVDISGAASVSPSTVQKTVLNIWPATLAETCGFDGNTNALQFIRMMYELPSLEISDLDIYFIEKK